MQWALNLAGCLILSTLLAGVPPARADVDYNAINIDNFDRLPSRTSFGTVSFRYRDGTVVKKKIMKEDVVNIAKAVYYEGAMPDIENGSVTAWTILQRQFCVPKRLGDSFSSFFKAFSQPINPEWTCKYGSSKAECRHYEDPKDGGKIKNFCDKDAKNYFDPESTDGPCAKKKLDDRVEYQDMKWKSVNESARVFALRFALGDVRNYGPGSVDFVESRKKWMRNDKYQKDRKRAFIYKRYGGRTEEYGGGNAFYYEKCFIEAPGSTKGVWSDSWDGSEVTITPPAGYAPSPYEPIEAEKLVEELDFKKPQEPLEPAKVKCETQQPYVSPPPFIGNKPWIVPFHSPEPY